MVRRDRFQAWGMRTVARMTGDKRDRWWAVQEGGVHFSDAGGLYFYVTPLSTRESAEGSVQRRTQGAKRLGRSRQGASVRGPGRASASPVLTGRGAGLRSDNEASRLRGDRRSSSETALEGCRGYPGIAIVFFFWGGPRRSRSLDRCSKKIAS